MAHFLGVVQELELEDLPQLVLLQSFCRVAAFVQPYLIVKLFQFDVSDFFKTRDFGESEFETNVLQTLLQREFFFMFIERRLDVCFANINFPSVVAVSHGPHNLQRAYAQSPQGDKFVRTGCRVTIGYSHSHYDQ